MHELADGPELARIAASEQWPTIYAFDEQGLEQRAIRDKAHARGAAFLMDMPASDGRSWLEIVRVVFLPTGDESAEALVIEGAIADRSFRLVLHGYFFLDAGRQMIEALDEAGWQEDSLASDAAVRRSWNRAARDRVVLPLVPEAVDRAHHLNRLPCQVVGGVSGYRLGGTAVKLRLTSWSA